MKVSFGGFHYEIDHMPEDNSVCLRTYDPELKVQINMICEQTSDSERNWNEFWKLFAKNAAEYFSKKIKN